jgi:flagellar basal body-associated protein FliL
MNDALALIIISLLVLIVVILLWHGAILARIARGIEQPSTKPKRAPVVEMPGSTSEFSLSTPQTDFDRFLAEDPARHQLAKKEQAAAYRAWRKERGFTWNAG